MAVDPAMADLSQATQVRLWLDQLSQLAVPIIALFGAAYTAREYGRSKRWRAGDLAVSVIAQLETDSDLAFACRAIDWGVGPMIVPERYRPLLEKTAEGQMKPTPVERGEVMRHNPELMARAVQVNLAIDPETEPGGLIYRYCFDKLFAHLANVYRLLETEQVKLYELEGLKYWLERIAVYEYPPPGTEGDRVFQPFLEHEPYGYRGVIYLGERLGVAGWIKAWQKQGKPNAVHDL